ncbi:hypothetical protein BKH41_03660 [Helicobacter sp. 12S02232-10]|uniref:hypothetical protein n=1 Tax=Helicobacter sp. 12S02232-10 TaxID=1476197 RepID=UPI000BA63BC4|nr:hypothetical protein [Helicobacter sp. 12S02232-10]PAF49189.1 hypothetical protein BKH41_03660 [Helicobacter sp. 12S02232-10]
MTETEYRRMLKISITQSLIQKYGAILSFKEMENVIPLREFTIRDKITKGAIDLPRYTQLEGKRVFLANDIAEWMVDNDLKFPKD